MFGAGRIATYWTGGGGEGYSPPAAGFDISTATTGYSLTAYVGTEDNTANDLYFSSDGTKMYIVGGGNDRVYQYNLGTAWNVYTAAYSTFVSVSSQENNPNALAFSSDGTKMYVLGQTNDTVYQYTLSTAWSLSTASYASKSFSVGGQEVSPVGLDFSSDGTKMYVLGFNLDTVYQYTLSTAWDVSTASYASKSYSTASQDGNPQGLRFNGDGTKMYTTGGGNDRLYQYSLSTAWDVSTASYSTVFYAFGTVTAENTPSGIYVRSDTSHVYMVGNAIDFVYDFTISTTSDISTATLSTTDNIRLGAQDVSPQDFVFGDSGTKAYIVGGNNNRVYQYALSTAWDINSMTYDNKNIAVNTQETAPRALGFSSDGTKMYIVGQTSDTVFQYTLSTAWDVSTATYASKSFAVGTQETGPNGLAFKSDGTKMYVTGDTSDRVYQYSLSTAWDVSTASYDSVSLLVSSQDGVPYGLAFKSDGTKMLVAGAANDKIYQYSLSTAWDLSTATYESKTLNIKNVDNTVTGIAISDDSTKLYVCGSGPDRLVQFTLA